MAVTTVGTSTASFSFSAVTVNKPTGVQVGDLIVILICANGSTNNETIAGFNAILGKAGNVSLDFFSRVADGTEGASFTSSSMPNQNGTAGCIVLRGVDTTTPILGNSTEAGGASSTTINWNGVSWAGAADAVSLLAVSWQTTNAAITWPGGWNQSPDGLSTFSGEGTGIGCNLTTQSAVTSLPSQSGSFASAEYNESCQYAIKVATAAAATGPSQFPRRAPRA